MLVVMVAVFRSANQEAKKPVAKGQEEAQFVSEFVGDDRIKSRAVVHKEHPDVGVFVFPDGTWNSGGQL